MEAKKKITHLAPISAALSFKPNIRIQCAKRPKRQSDTRNSTLRPERCREALIGKILGLNSGMPYSRKVLETAALCGFLRKDSNRFIHEFDSGRGRGVHCTNRKYQGYPSFIVLLR